MQKSSEVSTIMEMIVRARQINPQIGNYKSHAFVLEHPWFYIQLDNGTLRILAELTQDFSANPTANWEAEIASIASTFELGARLSPPGQVI